MAVPLRWEERYRCGDLPWDAGRPDAHLMDFVSSGVVRTGRALEIGSGTGTNAIYLAEAGFDVTGVDISPTATQHAMRKARERGVRCTFAAHDFLLEPTLSGHFDLIFDRGCFHSFDESDDQSRFAHNVRALLEPGGFWLSLIGSTEGEARDMGPPRRSARDIVLAVEPSLEVVSLVGGLFDSEMPHPARMWKGVFQRRTHPPQPSTRRA